MNAVYVVLIINLVIWTGLFFYLYKTDRSVRQLKQEIEDLDLMKDSKSLTDQN
ncbi:MAG: CcmD family protein [Calditrichaeota bacterium]|nr:CcmD family protein [Calditrichota bacterium]